MCWRLLFSRCGEFLREKSFSQVSSFKSTNKRFSMWKCATLENPRFHGIKMESEKDTVRWPLTSLWHPSPQKAFFSVLCGKVTKSKWPLKQLKTLIFIRNKNSCGFMLQILYLAPVTFYRRKQMWFWSPSWYQIISQYYMLQRTNASHYENACVLS